MPRKIGAFHLCYRKWLGLVYLFQTFEELDRVVDKQAEIKEVRQLLDEEQGDE